LPAKAAWNWGRVLSRRTFRTAPTQAELDSQAFAAFGTARVDHSAAATGFHADQKAVGTGAANFRGLVRAFHFEFLSILCFNKCSSSELPIALSGNFAPKNVGSLPLSPTFGARARDW